MCVTDELPVAMETDYMFICVMKVVANTLASPQHTGNYTHPLSSPPPPAPNYSLVSPSHLPTYSTYKEGYSVYAIDSVKI